MRLWPRCWAMPYRHQKRPCYEGFKSLQPIEVCWAETGLVPASMDNRRLVDEACQALPSGDWDIWIRSDSAAYEQDNLDHWDGLGQKFAVSVSILGSLLHIQVEVLGSIIVAEEFSGGKLGEEQGSVC